MTKERSFSSVERATKSEHDLSQNKAACADCDTTSKSGRSVIGRFVLQAEVESDNQSGGYDTASFTTGMEPVS